MHPGFFMPKFTNYIYCTMDTTNAVLETIKQNGKPMKAGEIATASGLEKKDVEKAIKTLVKEEKLHSPVRCFYDIKK